VEGKDGVHRAYSTLTAIPVAEVEHHRWPPFDGSWLVTIDGTRLDTFYRLVDAKRAAAQHLNRRERERRRQRRG